nr:hypothetical protein Iba_chr04fCG12680 [Ipomoea batatas]
MSRSRCGRRGRGPRIWAELEPVRRLLGHHARPPHGVKQQNRLAVRQNRHRRLRLTGKRKPVIDRSNLTDTEAAREVELARRVRALVTLGALHGAALTGVVILRRQREVRLGFRPPELPRRRIISPHRLLRRVKCPQLHPALLPRVPDFGGVTPPRPLPHSSKVRSIITPLKSAVSKGEREREW